MLSVLDRAHTKYVDHLQVSLFGTTTVVGHCGHRIDDLGGIKPRQLLESLAIAEGQSVSKSDLAERVWDGSPPASAMASLESYVCVLRRTLHTEAMATAGAQGTHRRADSRVSPIRTTNSGYLLDPELVQVDLVEARGLLRLASKAQGFARSRLINSVLDLVTGELLLSSRNTSWASEERIRFDTELVAACTDAARLALDSREFVEALRLSEYACRRDSLAEAAWEVRIRALSGLGRHAEGLRAYEEVRTELREELGVDPSPYTKLAFDDLLEAMKRRGQDTETYDIGELRSLLALMRQTLEAMPGVAAPNCDTELSAVAVRVLR